MLSYSTGVKPKPVGRRKTSLTEALAKVYIVKAVSKRTGAPVASGNLSLPLCLIGKRVRLILDEVQYDE